jgi:archaemetzincin
MQYRGLKTSCHEILHLFGLKHCIYMECLMNGSNLITESDRKPINICPVCLKKLGFYHKLNVRNFMEKFLNGLQQIENDHFNSDIELLEK